MRRYGNSVTAVLRAILQFCYGIERGLWWRCVETSLIFLNTTFGRNCQNAESQDYEIFVQARSRGWVNLGIS